MYSIFSRCSILWKFSLHIVYISRTARNFFSKFRNSDGSFNRNILTLLRLKFETSVHTQIAITRYDILFTNFLTYYEIKTHIGDTL